jgi:hypothetical protein
MGNKPDFVVVEVALSGPREPCIYWAEAGPQVAEPAMTTSMIANARVWNAVVFPSVMTCLHNEPSPFSPAAPVARAVNDPCF